MRTCKTESQEKSSVNASAFHNQRFVRELKRNSGKHGRYTWQLAHTKAMERRERTCSNGRTPAWLVDKALKYLVEEQWSPKQISGYMRIQRLHISHERIYQAIRDDDTGELRKHCRHRMKYRRHGSRRRREAGRTLIPTVSPYISALRRRTADASATGRWTSS